MVTIGSSLRERSKLKRRSAIQRAGMQLFTERGYDVATIADIADLAELAPRTVTMYFPSKIDIAMSASNDIVDRLTAVFQAHPDLHFTEVIDRWLTAEERAPDRDLAALTAAMLAANPPLRGVWNTRVAQATASIGPALTAELDLPADHPMVRVATAAMNGAISEYLTLISSDAASASPGSHREFIAFLSAILAAIHPPLAD